MIPEIFVAMNVIQSRQMKFETLWSNKNNLPTGTNTHTHRIVLMQHSCPWKKKKQHLKKAVARDPNMKKSLGTGSTQKENFFLLPFFFFCSGKRGSFCPGPTRMAAGPSSSSSSSPSMRGCTPCKNGMVEKKKIAVFARKFHFFSNHKVLVCVFDT
jgi:hypothetical protein